MVRTQTHLEPAGLSRQVEVSESVRDAFGLLERKAVLLQFIDEFMCVANGKYGRRLQLYLESTFRPEARRRFLNTR